MKVKAISIGNTQIKNNIFLAPVAGYTNYAFRHQSLKNGYGLCFTELVSAKGLCYSGTGNFELLKCDGDIDKTAVQIFGHEPYYMRKAIEEHLQQFAIIDINMGCPVNKVFKNGDGSALLTNIHLAKNVLSECVKTGKNITVKIRTGIREGEDIASDYAKMCEDVGVKLVTIHGRVRDAFYSGEVNYSAIKRAKDSVSIPVIANGGIFTVADADKIMEETEADGVMLARGGIENPFLVCELLGKQPEISLKEFIKAHLSLSASVLGDERTAVEFRKFAPYYFKNKKDSKLIREKIMNTRCVSEIFEILDNYF